MMNCLGIFSSSKRVKWSDKLLIWEVCDWFDRLTTNGRMVTEWMRKMELQ